MTPIVFLDLRDTTSCQALVHACEAAGWARASVPTPRAAVVADQLVTHGRSRLDALVIEASPAASRQAMEAFASGRVAAVVVASEPHTLPRALELASAGYGVVPRVVVEAAERLPEIPPRLDRVLQLVLRGRTNAAISRALQQSLSSTKRDISTLLHLFDAPNRQVLVASAVRMGIHPHGR